MTDNYRLQASPVLADGTMLNIRAESTEEFAILLGWVKDNGVNITDAIGSLKAQGNVAATFPGSQNVQQDQGSRSQQGSQQAPPAFVPQQAAPQGAPQGPGSSCAHGPMVYREGVGKKGPWKAYFCPTPRGTAGQCDPQFIR